MDDLGVPRTPISATPYLIGSPGYAFPSGVRRTELRCFGEFCSATTQHAQSSQALSPWWTATRRPQTMKILEKLHEMITTWCEYMQIAFGSPSFPPSAQGHWFWAGDSSAGPPTRPGDKPDCSTSIRRGVLKQQQVQVYSMTRTAISWFFNPYYCDCQCSVGSFCKRRSLPDLCSCLDSGLGPVHRCNWLHHTPLQGDKDAMINQLRWKRQVVQRNYNTFQPLTWCTRPGLVFWRTQDPWISVQVGLQMHGAWRTHSSGPSCGVTTGAIWGFK